MVQHRFGIVQQRFQAECLDIQSLGLNQVRLVDLAVHSRRCSIAIQYFQCHIAKHPSSEIGPFGILVEVAKRIGNCRLQNVCRLIGTIQRTRTIDRQLMLNRFKVCDESLRSLRVGLSQRMPSRLFMSKARKPPAVRL